MDRWECPANARGCISKAACKLDCTPQHTAIAATAFITRALACLTAISSPVSLSMATHTLPKAPCPTSSPFVQLMGLRCSRPLASLPGSGSPPTAACGAPSRPSRSTGLSGDASGPAEACGNRTGRGLCDGRWGTASRQSPTCPIVGRHPPPTLCAHPAVLHPPQCALAAEAPVCR